MVDFTRQREFKTRDAVLPVDKGLRPGVYVFQLVVEDERGNRSNVAQARVEVVRIGVPFIPVVPIIPVIGVTPVLPVQPVLPVLTPVQPIRPVRPRRRPKPK